MKVEETVNHAVLVKRYSDAELLDIEHAIVASIPPEESMIGLRWMIGHINTSERAFLFGGMRQEAPQEVFAAWAVGRDCGRQP